MKKLFVFLVPIFALNAACASKGFNRGKLSQQAGIETPTYTDAEIKAHFKKKPNLPKPFKVAVYFAQTQGSGDWRWTEEDKKILESLAEELRAQGAVSDIFVLGNSVVKDDDLKTIRVAAARTHADALLVIGGAADVDRYINKAGWAYALLLPTFFVPGSEADTLFVTTASLWDVRNEFLYLNTEAEALTKKRYVAAFGDQDKKLIEKAKGEALAKLKVGLSDMLKGAKL